MYEADFGGCRAKLYRAVEHRDALQSYVSKHITAEDNRPTIGIKFKPETGEHAVYVSSCPDYGPHLERCSVLLGDAIQNLRVPLDYLAFQLALRNKNAVLDNHRRIQFPIEDEPEMFRKRCTATGPRDSRAWIAEISGDDQKILERYQPYHAEQGDVVAKRQAVISGSHCGFLRVLREISDGDKHRLPEAVLIPPVRLDKVHLGVGMIAYGHMRRQRETGEGPIPITIEAGAEIFWGKMPDWPETNVQVAGYITPLIAIHIGQMCRLMPTVDQVVRIVHLLLAEFDPILKMKRLVNEV